MERINIRANLRQRFQGWMASRIKPTDNITLDRRIIYILPTRNGLMFVFAAGLVFIAAINYAVSLAFGLAFMMISVFILAILYAFNNLNQLQLSGKNAPSVYAGDLAGFRIQLKRNPKRSHENLELSFPDSLVAQADLVTLDQDSVEVFTEASKRGLFKAPLLRVATLYPLGLCRAWTVVNLNLECVVYPKPVTFVMSQFTGGSSGQDDSAMTISGSEDYYGLRDYVPGDSLRQVAWKNVARGQGLQLKEFVDYVDSKIWLEWDMFYGFSTEERLSRLCYCVIKLAKSGNPYGLKLPGIEIQPQRGEGHKINLLKTLALFGKT